MLTALPPFAGRTPAGVHLDDSIHLSSVTGAGSGLRDEVRSAWDGVLARLHTSGVDDARVVRVVEYITTQAVPDHDTIVAARVEALGAFPVAVSTVVVPGVMDGDRRVALEVVAQRSGATSSAPGAVRAGHTVYLESVDARDRSGRIVGDHLAAQLDRAFGTAAALLTPLGLSLANVVLTVDHTTAATRRDYRATGAVRRERLGPVYPGAAGILQDRLLHPDALVSLDVVASTEPLEPVNPGWERYQRLTYSPAVRAGSTLFMSGQGALDPATEQAVHAGDLRAQTEYTYRNVDAVLRAAGAVPADLVQTVEYLTPESVAQSAAVDEARAAVFGDHPIATTRVLCAGLLRPEFLIEVIPLAVLS